MRPARTHTRPPRLLLANRRRHPRRGREPRRARCASARSRRSTSAATPPSAQRTCGPRPRDRAAGFGCHTPRRSSSAPAPDGDRTRRSRPGPRGRRRRVRSRRRARPATAPRAPAAGRRHHRYRRCPPTPTTIRVHPASSARRINSPVPRDVACSASTVHGGTSRSPEASASSTTDVVVSSMPSRAVTGRAQGSRHPHAGPRVDPGRAARSTSSVPSPPSATGLRMALAPASRTPRARALRSGQGAERSLERVRRADRDGRCAQEAVSAEAHAAQVP